MANSDKLWGMTVEVNSSGGTVLCSYKGKLTIVETPGGVSVYGKVLHGRWDGREPTDENLDFKIRSIYNKYRPAHKPQEQFSEIASWDIPKTFSGRGALGKAQAWAWGQLTVVPITVPFDVAKARNTGEGVRDWVKFVSVLAAELEFKRGNRAPDLETFKTLASDVLRWDGKSPLPNEDYLRKLYNERVLGGD